MNLPNLKSVLSLAVTAAAGAFLGYVQSHAPADPLSTVAWKPVLLAAGAAAAIAVVHLYQPKPGQS